jgi:hypothetical protein
MESRATPCDTNRDEISDCASDTSREMRSYPKPRVCIGVSHIISSKSAPPQLV